jgi:hypothetical protein
MKEIITTDFSKFGGRERRMAEELLKASREQGFPDDFEDDQITIMFNMESSKVFFTNSEFQVAMMNEDKLESFYACPGCGHEGFKDEMNHNGNSECTRYLKDIGVIQITDEENEEGEE